MTCENGKKWQKRNLKVKMADFLFVFGYGAKILFFMYGHDTHVYRFPCIFVKPYGGAAALKFCRGRR